jgi:hypothetical protein
VFVNKPDKCDDLVLGREDGMRNDSAQEALKAAATLELVGVAMDEATGKGDGEQGEYDD